jgi:hypothetical protein
VDAVAEAPGGSWPLGDDAALSRYAKASRSQAGFDALLAEWLA